MNRELSEYLKSQIKDYLFTEIDPGFLDANDLGFLRDVSIPIKPSDLKSFTESGLPTTAIADNMAMVVGADPDFKFADRYIRYIKTFFNEKIVDVYASKAEELLDSGSYRMALCYLRAALMYEPDSKHAMYCYANGCRIWYQSMEGEDQEKLIALLKSEANEYFAQLTNLYPEFAPGWYYLGYAYLNAGKYTKAEIAFRHYLDNSTGMPEEDVKEIKERVAELKDPVKIEAGKNLLLAGRFEDALAVLEPYVESKYAGWWPLHYYLAVAYEQLGNTEEAIEGYLNVIKLEPSNYDANLALSQLYEETGNYEKAKKYSDKAELIRSCPSS